jgi:hypothetical protein
MKKMTEIISDIDKNIYKLFLKHLENLLLKEAIPEVIDRLMKDYDLNLTSAVTDRKSKTRPELYQDLFLERLEDFEYIELRDDELDFITPDIDNFDFSGRLSVIKTILEGTAGIHVEVSATQYELMFGKPPYREDPLDVDVPKKERIYIMRYTPKLRALEKDRLAPINDELIRYPFSNIPPIDLFLETNEYVEEKLMPEMINNAIENSIKEYKNNPRRLIRV